MSSLLIRNARVLTMGAAPSPPAAPSVSSGPRRGRDAMNDLGVLPSADVFIDRGIISLIQSPSRDHLAARAIVMGQLAAADSIDAAGRVLMPAFADAHTHALWAGDRLEEWELKRKGVPYLDILKAGGGIMSTVRAVRAASQAELEDRLRARLAVMLREGTTLVEVKSGYGLSTEHELKMLRAIATVAAEAARGGGAAVLPRVVPTALLGHALDPDVPAHRFIDTTINETLPAVSAEFPGIAVDAFCEEGAWPQDACVRLFEKARALGHPIRIHADQFNCLGMTEWALEADGVLSVDHLEASRLLPRTWSELNRRDVAPVVLPCTGFHTDGRYADGRALVDAGAPLVLATNCNPGSSPCSSMPMAIALAVRFLHLTPAEAITSCTINAAMLLCRQDPSLAALAPRGIIAPGAAADLILLRHTDERLLACEFGGNPIDAVITGGTVVTMR